MRYRVFLDTNVFAYMFDQADPHKQQIARAQVEELHGSHRAVVSFQVVQEFISVMVHRFRKPMQASDQRMFLERIMWPMCEVFPDLALYSDAIALHNETEWSFYDSLIVCAAIRAECGVLLTEDLQAGRVVRGVEIRNPFA